MTIYIVLAVILIVSLASYAGKLLLAVKAQTKANKLQLLQREQLLQAHDEKILLSVAIIVKAMQAQQCDLSEGCWRTSVLIDSLNTSTQLAAKFPAIYGLYSKVKDMAIMDERKKIAKQQRMREDYNRLKFEAEYQEAIFQDLKLLAEFTNTKIKTQQSH